MKFYTWEQFIALKVEELLWQIHVCRFLSYHQNQYIKQALPSGSLRLHLHRHPSASDNPSSVLHLYNFLLRRMYTNATMQCDSCIPFESSFSCSTRCPWKRTSVVYNSSFIFITVFHGTGVLQFVEFLTYWEKFWLFSVIDDYKQSWWAQDLGWILVSVSPR